MPYRHETLDTVAIPRKPEGITMSTADWERGVTIWWDYCTRPNINWRRHGAMCERLLYGGQS